ncbi:MAG: hypothetical protein P8L85_24440 [Rubripirellula sp.]|nr:hypothetical protein [Rubripirellula sp.]
MRFIAISISLLAAAQAFSQKLEPATALRWSKPFEAISPTVNESHLVLLVITNDDPFQAEEHTPSPPKSGTEKSGTEKSDIKKSEGELVIEEPPVWCGRLLAKAIGKALKVRPDLNDNLSLQALSAGLPPELTAGVPSNQPARAIVFLCDTQYRLLALSVGVPDVDQLLQMIEDAQDVNQSLLLDPELTHRDLVHALADRNQPRLARLWRNTLHEITLAFDAKLDKPIRVKDLDPTVERVLELDAALKPAYELDVRLRFGLNDATDHRRLVILEQHPQARLAWCEALTPFVASFNMLDHWRGLVETVWGFPPITAETDSELQTWVTEQLPSNPVILLISPTQQAALLPWPPATGGKRNQAWKKVHEQALAHPYRSVNYQQLATLIHLRQLRPIDAVASPPIRYIMLDRNTSTPATIRENDPPGRFASMLNRSRLKTAEVEAPNR